MKRSVGVKINILIPIILLVALVSTLAFNVLMPQNVISHALLGIAIFLAVFQLKKTNEKL